MVIQYWNGADHINVAAWISIIIAIVVCLNLFAVAVYGEAEFIFASIKIIAIVGLLLFAFIVDLGGGPTKDRLGFRYWKHPGAMKAYVSDGSAGRFFGFFSTLVNASFAYGGVEMVAVAAGEAENPRKVWLKRFLFCLLSVHYLNIKSLGMCCCFGRLTTNILFHRTYPKPSGVYSGVSCFSMYLALWQ